MTNTDWQEKHDYIADRLRQMRLAAGLTGKGLADRYDWQQSKISRLENGRQLPSPDDITKWVAACGGAPEVAEELISVLAAVQDGHRNWRRRMRRGPAAIQADYNRLVAAAGEVRHFETVYIPGLLQTAEYAHHILAEGASLAGAVEPDIAAAVAMRMQRQQYLYDPAHRFEFLLAEPVLRWLLVPPVVMRGQLDRLQSVLGLPNIRLGILPLGRRVALAPQNSFQLYDGLAVVETFVGEWTHSDDDSAVYASVLERLWESAAEGEAARRLIIQAQADLVDV